jgi:gluconate 5-dehydrogenase
MAADLIGSDITVNLLLPGGATLTGMVPDEHQPANVEFLDPSIMGPPIVWLASREATGTHDTRIVATEFESWLSARSHRPSAAQ